MRRILEGLVRFGLERVKRAIAFGVLKGEPFREGLQTWCKVISSFLVWRSRPARKDKVPRQKPDQTEHDAGKSRAENANRAVLGRL